MKMAESLDKKPDIAFAFALVEFKDKDKTLAVIKRSDICEINNENLPADAKPDCVVWWKEAGKRKPTKHAAVVLRFAGNIFVALIVICAPAKKRETTVAFELTAVSSPPYGILLCPESR